MSDDTRRILDLLAQGRITVDDADRLLQAIGADAAGARAGGTADGGGAPSTGDATRGDAATAPAGARPKPRFLRIAVHKPASPWRPDKDVTIRVPIALVKGGMKLGAIIPGLGGKPLEARLREQGLDVDLSSLDEAAIDRMLSQVGDAMDIDIDSGKAQVHISCE